MRVMSTMLCSLCVLAVSGHVCKSGTLRCMSVLRIQSNRNASLDLDCLVDEHAHHGCPEGQTACCFANSSDGDVNAAEIWYPLAVFAVASIALALITCICSRAWLARRFQGKEVAPPQGISAAQIRDLFPEVTVEDNPQCVVCLSEIEESGRKLQCGHYFHSECIVAWWTFTPRSVIECPTCKRIQCLPASKSCSEVPPPEHSSEASRQGPGRPEETFVIDDV
jgi:hypothetical protein